MLKSPLHPNVADFQSIKHGRRPPDLKIEKGKRRIITNDKAHESLIMTRPCC